MSLFRTALLINKKDKTNDFSQHNNLKLIIIKGL